MMQLGQITRVSIYGFKGVYSLIVPFRELLQNIWQMCNVGRGVNAIMA
jgi:hypothetical protein